MPRVRRLLPISAIRMDRWPVNPRTFALAKHLEDGGCIPPIHVRPASHGLYAILDGRHRVTALKLLGRTRVEVRYGYKLNDKRDHEERQSTRSYLQAPPSPSYQADGWSNEEGEQDPPT